MSLLPRLNSLICACCDICFNLLLFVEVKALLSLCYIIIVYYSTKNKISMSMSKFLCFEVLKTKLFLLETQNSHVTHENTIVQTHFVVSKWDEKWGHILVDEKWSQTKRAVFRHTFTVFKKRLIPLLI